MLWVPGHSNIDGNETAGELAKQAALVDYVGPEPALGLYLMNIKYEISQWSVQEQNRRWRNIKSCRQAKQFMQAVHTTHTVCCTTVQEGLKIISRSFDWAQYFEPTSHLVEENG